MMSGISTFKKATAKRFHRKESTPWLTVKQLHQLKANLDRSLDSYYAFVQRSNQEYAMELARREKLELIRQRAQAQMAKVVLQVNYDYITKRIQKCKREVSEYVATHEWCSKATKDLAEDIIWKAASPSESYDDELPALRERLAEFEQWDTEDMFGFFWGSERIVRSMEYFSAQL